MHGERRVLIVEDDAIIREALSEVLADEGFGVATARHGREALSQLQAQAQSPPCVVLLDLMMPVMDGWQLLEFMQHDSRLARIPVVVVSAAREEGAPSGAVTCLKKPINLDALLSEVSSRCCRLARA